MHKARVIATCLVNSGMFGTLHAAELAVQQVFSERHPQAKFSDWNTDMNDAAAQHIIAAVGRAGQIKVDQFILDLWQ